MDLIKEIKEIKKQLSKLEKFVEEVKQLTIADIKVGEQFVYGGSCYTKLNEECFVIIDDFVFDFMYCIFDPITSNYDESLIRYYINSDRFIEKLGVDKKDIITHYLDDYITLLSEEEFENYKKFIRNYDGRYWTRSASSDYIYRVCVIGIDDAISSSYISDANRVRVCFTLNPDTPVSRKVDK
jgi:hypothetical protein